MNELRSIRNKIYVYLLIDYLSDWPKLLSYQIQSNRPDLTPVLTSNKIDNLF
jgi:hypothetical protein